MTDATELDRTLQELAKNPTYDMRVRALQQLVEYWHGPITAADGYAPEELAGLRLPRALRWWYSWAGKRKETTSGDGRFIGPEIDNPPDEFGRIYCWNENQGVFQRAISADGDDPLVYQSDWDRGNEWTCEGMSLLELLMQLCIYEAKSEHWGLIDISQAQLEEFATRVPRLPASPWQTWDPESKFAVDFHVGGGIYAEVNDLIGGYTLGVKAKTPGELHWLNLLLPSEKWTVKDF